MAGLLSFLEQGLIHEILEFGVLKRFPKDSIIIREGQYLKQLPVILKGIVKVYSQYDGKELLLYYIMPKQSCIMSFAAATYNDPSAIFAVTGAECDLLLLPKERINEWSEKYPRFNRLFFELYQKRYLDLLETINQLVFKNLDERILAYLKNKQKLSEGRIIKLRHLQIATDLGTAREVVTRILKKLEKENKIRQTHNGIEIL